MPGNPHECRKHAKTCLKLAEEATLPEVKPRFEALAQRWLEIASDLEATMALLAEWGGDWKKPEI